MFEKAVAAIELARSKGFRVTVNCTLFNGEDPEDVAEFFDTAMALGVEGITVSPGYSYHHAPRQDVFLGRNASKQLFRKIFSRRRRPSRQRLGLSITRRCFWIFWRATKPISARRGAIRPITFSAGRDLATYCPTKAMRRPTARSSRTPSGTTMASAAIRGATTAWRTADLRERRSMTLSAIPFKALLTSYRGPRVVGPDGSRTALPVCRRRTLRRRGRDSAQRHQAHEPRVR